MLAIRDVKDRPILRAALATDADILVIGDKDFLEAGIHEITLLSGGLSQAIGDPALSEVCVLSTAS